MPSPNEIATRMVAALSAAEPELDTSVGTPIRKVLDTVAEAIAESTIDSYLVDYQYDIDSRVGADLDAFAALFGFYRLTARRAIGTILLQRTTPAPASILIPSGSQASTGGASPIIVRTIVPAVFPRSSVVLEIPVETVTGGADANLPASGVTRWLSSIEGITSVTNPAPLTGGSDAESDSQFRERIKGTLFRNLAGTKDAYLAAALAMESATEAQVYGAYERWTERIDFIDGKAEPTIASFVRSRPFARSEVTSSDTVVTMRAHNLHVGDYVELTDNTESANDDSVGLLKVASVISETEFSLVDLDGQAVTFPATGTVDVHRVNRMREATYSGHALGKDLGLNQVLPRNLYDADFDGPPRFEFIDPELEGGVYEVSFMYSSQGSRNRPFRTINATADRVDVWVAGMDPEQAQAVVVADTRNVIEVGSTKYPPGAYRRRDGAYAALDTDSIIVPLPMSPAMSIPSTIEMGDRAYHLGEHYFLVDRVVPDEMGSMEGGSAIEMRIEETTDFPPSERSIASGTNATPVVLTTSSAHRFRPGQRVRVEGYSQSQINGDWYIQAVGADTITLQGSTAPGGAGSGGTVHLFHPVSLDYTFNATPLGAQRAIEEWRMASSDVLVHAPDPLPLRIYMAIILDRGYTQESIQPSIESVIRNVLHDSGIGGVVQISDLLNAVSSLSGVDAVRMIHGRDAPNWTVTDITPTATNVTFTVSGTLTGISPGDLIDVMGVQGAAADVLNEVFRVASVTSNTVVVEGSFSDAGAWSGNPTLYHSTYGIVIMSPDGTTPMFQTARRTAVPHPVDVFANDYEHFILHSVELSIRGQNSWIS